MYCKNIKYIYCKKLDYTIIIIIKNKEDFKLIMSNEKIYIIQLIIYMKSI